MNMTCRQAMQLISLEADRRISHCDNDRLAAHLRQCASCADYKRKLAAAMALVETDAAAYRTHPGPSDEFASRLQSALVEERNSRLCTPITALDVLLQAWAAGMSARCRQAATAAAALAAAAGILLLASAAVTPPSSGPAQPRFGHIASFSAHADADGRVYAQLSEKTTGARSALREAVE